MYSRNAGNIAHIHSENVTIKQQKNAVYRGHVHFNAVEENLFFQESKIKLQLTLKVLAIFNTMT